ncbi:hypothetical protein [Endozoicomonas acroporae]|uniref:hypothetical protein n=1 Tax=Endozoicomonas acroporae TaxID=1701104 RepID=UPI003D79FC00
MPISTTVVVALFGRHGGALSSIRPDDLLGDIIRTLIQRNAFDLNQYEDVKAVNYPI